MNVQILQGRCRKDIEGAKGAQASGSACPVAGVRRPGRASDRVAELEIFRERHMLILKDHG